MRIKYKQMFIKGEDMAKKIKTVFMCQECGYESPKWMGKCICGAWNSFVEEKVIPLKEEDSRRRGSAVGMGKARANKLKGITTDKDIDRIDTKIGELNRVLGGGIVRGSLVLISGEPGIGKSTIIMQAANNIAISGRNALYVSGEESEIQIKMRADRICKDISDNLMVLSETNMESIYQCVKENNIDFLIIDSIQTIYSSQIDAAPGSVSQVRVCGNELMKIGKSLDIPVFIVAHVTKSGDLAGPKIVEHLVDCVLHFTGERNHELRILRSFKNRFGTTSEIGAFEMAESGLVEVENLSKLFIDDMDNVREGAVIGAIYEGTRPLLLEIQGLTAQTNVGFARRTTIGVDSARLNMVLAILERKVGISMINQDVYVNIVGGLKPEGTYTDLGVALAIYSSYSGRIPPNDTIVVGEIGLTGEIRNIQNIEKILKEAYRMGYRKAILPWGNERKLSEKIKKAMTIMGCKNIQEAVKFYFD